MVQEYAWQKKCTQALESCVALGERGANAWLEVREALGAEAEEKIQPRVQARIIIADCDLRGRDLQSYSFQHVYLARVDFTGADLRGADFDRAIINACWLVRTDLRRAKFDRTKIDQQTIGWYAVIDRSTTLAFTGGTESLVGFDPDFRFSAEEGVRIAEFRRRNRNPVLGLIFGLLDYGRSIWRLLVLYAVISAFFAAVYWVSYLTGGLTFDAGHWSFLAFNIMSAQRFLNANPMFGSDAEAAQTLFLAEAALGYGALGVFSAVLLRKIIIFR
jgi:Pentapeptide repeats (8 copies)